MFKSSGPPSAPRTGTIVPPKRRTRQTSPGCMAAFFGIFFLFGLGFLGIFVVQGYRDYRIHTVYRQTSGTVTGKRLLTSRGSKGGTTYRPEFDFNYEVNGRTYRTSGYDGWKMYSSRRSSHEAALAEFQTGRTYPVWYDPADPSRAVLKRHYSWMYAFALIPLIFAGIGVIGMIWALKKKRGPSREARDYQKARAQPGKSAAQIPEIETEHGSTLDVRLGRQTSDLVKVISFLFFALFVNGLTGFMAYHVMTSVKGVFRFGVLAFLGIFALVGLLLIGLFFYQLLVWLGVGETTVEVTRARLAPGEAFEIHVSQGGNMQINKLTLHLVCEEQATYRVGTNTNTVREKVLEQPLAVREHFTVARGRPFTLREKCTVPAGAIHSFKAASNEIRWRIEVKGDIARWPDFERHFPILVEARPPRKGETGEETEAKG